ncbi:hypothetical protein SLS56_011241 [Neofusicoccum ribis]|uniref:MYND-type domain-containing protein n=1 Tax=Neofusicoccum ribis TaxID=45134 RepID=A0ABR3SC84_9PEZI
MPQIAPRQKIRYISIATSKNTVEEFQLRATVVITKQCVRLRDFFYPIGNTPAVNLLRDVTTSDSHQTQPQALEILLLACGDPRSILFSLHSESALSRNLLLFTLLADRSKPDNTTVPGHITSATALWNIFYHMFVADSELAIIQHQAQQLADLATSPDSWSSSPYGSWAKFLDDDTRIRTRSVWLQYAETSTFTKEQSRAFERRGRNGISNMYKTKVQHVGVMGGAVRSAGAHAARAAEVMATAYRAYWTTGVVGGNEEDVAALEIGGRGRMNPLFAVSSASNGDFAVHYGSDPLHGFHLAQAFDLPVSTKGPDTINRLVNLAKSEFREWCDGLVRHLEASRGLLLSFYCGDALRLCFELQAHNPRLTEPPAIARIYKDSWSVAPIHLSHVEDGGDTDFFDIVDTSNLLDYVGILNVLPAVVPLIRRNTSSVMYTESLLRASLDPMSSLSSMLCADVKTMSLLLGIAPTPYLTGVSTDSYIPEISSCMNQQFRLRVPWRVPALGHQDATTEASELSSHGLRGLRPSFRPEQLTEFLFRLYLNMFQHEDWSKTLSQTASSSMMRQLASPVAGDLRYYSRINLALLCALIKSNVNTDWEECNRRLLEKIESDSSLMIGTNNLQELFLHFHTSALSPNVALENCPRDLGLSPFGMFAPLDFNGGLLGEPDPPSVAFLALVVPRSKLRIFTNQSADQLGTPGLHISIRHGMMLENSFHSIQCFFGRIFETAQVGICTADEDGTGWKGTSDLVVVCQIPLFTLLLGPRHAVRVALAVDSTPSTVQFTMMLGPTNTVFEAGLADTNRLHLLRAPPLPEVHVEPCPPAKRQVITDEAQCSLVQITLDNNLRAETASTRSNLDPGTPASLALKDGARVTSTSESPCTVVVKIAGCSPITFRFPYPIDSRSLKTRVARQSSWVEVSAPLSGPLALTSSGKSFTPLLRDCCGRLFSWALPRVTLRNASMVQVPPDYGWIEAVLRAARNHREPAQLDESARPLSCLKESLLQIFVRAARKDRSGDNLRAIHLIRNDDVGCDTAIVPSAILHDADTGSIMLDAYFIPFEHHSIDSKSATDKFINAKLLYVSEDEEALWKHLLPATAERCRTWEHRDKCEYKSHGCAPVSILHGANPLCSCGEGAMLEGFPALDPYGQYRKHATRIAIPVLFAVPYVEDVRSSVVGLEALAADVGSMSLSSEAEHACANCGQVKQRLKLCQRCRKVWYCNHACQKAHWKGHKKACRGK